VTDDKVQIIVPNAGFWGQPLRDFSILSGASHASEVRFRIAESTELEPAIEERARHRGSPSTRAR
jgi:hypothetical protein